MDINWVILGWFIDMILNGFVWLMIAIIITPLMDIFIDGLEHSSKLH